MNSAVKLLFVCLSVMISQSSAYDWTDTDFNLILHDDLIESEHSLDNMYVPVRKARQASTKADNVTSPSVASAQVPVANVTQNNGCAAVPKQNSSSGGNSMGNNRYQRSCCGDREDLKMHGDALKELRKECFAEVKRNRGSKASDAEPGDMFSCEKVKQTKENLVCVMECVARKKQMVDENGNLVAANATAVLKDELATKDWQKEIIDRVVAKCINESNNTTEEAKKTSKAVEFCNTSSLKFSHCVWREMQLSCPKDQVRDTRSCQRMRERLQKKEYMNIELKAAKNQGKAEETKENGKKD